MLVLLRAAHLGGQCAAQGRGGRGAGRGGRGAGRAGAAGAVGAVHTYPPLPPHHLRPPLGIRPSSPLLQKSLEGADGGERLPGLPGPRQQLCVSRVRHADGLRGLQPGPELHALAYEEVVQGTQGAAAGHQRHCAAEVLGLPLTNFFCLK